jgi:ABC-type multidrug transport system fused ATPase/permease subunit
MINVIKAILFFPSVTKTRIMLLLGITLTAAFFEGFGVAMLFPVMDFIERGRDFKLLADSSRMWSTIEWVFDLFFIPKNLIALMFIVFLLLMIRQCFNFLKTIFSTWITESILSDIRSSGFKWLATADMAFYDSHGVGQLVNVLTLDGARAGGGIFSFFNLLTASMIFLLYFAFLMLISPGMTLFAVCIMGGVGAILKSRITKSGQIGIELSKNNEAISSSVVERLSGIRLLKLSATEESETDRIRELSEKIRMNSYHLAKIRARMEFTIDPMVILSGLIILYFSVEVFSMSLAKTGIFIFVLLRLMPYTRDMFYSRQGLAGFSGSLFRVKELLTKAQEEHKIAGGSVTELRVRQGIRFEDVFFSYNPDDGFVVRDLNVFIPAGKMTALIGRSGAGKSTLVDLIPRLRVPTRGRIYMDDLPIEQIDLRALRRSIAFVSQEGFLFNDTVENNLKYCRPEAGLDEVAEVAKSAYADQFVRSLPKGYQTIVGERGLKLSGGQKQRLILARALLQRALIIILDEPTSSLDSESEGFIQKAVDVIRSEGHITIIVIAHRLSTIRSADQIIVLDKGRVVDCGNHEALLHEDTWYADMVRLQAGS